MSVSPDVARIDLDPLGGIAGDMFAAALIDAFPEHLSIVLRDLAAAGVPDGVRVQVEETRNAGFRGARFAVEQRTSAAPPRTLAAMRSFLGAAALPHAVGEHALAIFTLLAEAEAHVHGASRDTVHFHEVSDWDSVVDIVAAASLIRALGDVRWRLGPLPLGGGTVNTAHGDIPVPAPATVQLLKGFQFVDDGTPGERVTPTGAAILAHLRPADASGSGACAQTGRLLRIGIGCGTRTLPGRANILRATVFEEFAGNPDREIVERLAFEIDDMSGEELAVAVQHLRDSAGVLDVMQVPMQGKKGRNAVGIRLMVGAGQVEAAIEACFTQTSTLGLRQQQVLRRILPREHVRADLGPGDSISAKRTIRPGGRASIKVDSDVLATTGTLEERRSLAQRAAKHLAQEVSDE